MRSGLNGMLTMPLSPSTSRGQPKLVGSTMPWTPWNACAKAGAAGVASWVGAGMAVASGVAVAAAPGVASAVGSAVGLAVGAAVRAGAGSAVACSVGLVVAAGVVVASTLAT